MQVQVTNNHPKQINLTRLNDLTIRLLQAEDCSDMIEVSILLTNNDKIAALNYRYRDIEGPTDVLSFSLIEGEEFIDPSSIKALGDVVISIDYAEKQAAEQGHSLENELDILLVHGLLHLLGYDHMELDEGEVMFARQAEIIGETAE